MTVLHNTPESASHPPVLCDRDGDRARGGRG
jgi:hypothetical protein